MTQTNSRSLPQDFSPPIAKPSPRPSRQAKSILHPPSGFGAALGDAIAWIAASMAVRIGVNLLLASSTQFWIPGVFILTAPAIAAVYLSTRFPSLSLILGYRLVLIMFGLLLGGRL